MAGIYREERFQSQHSEDGSFTHFDVSDKTPSQHNGYPWKEVKPGGQGKGQDILAVFGSYLY